MPADERTQLAHTIGHYLAKGVDADTLTTMRNDVDVLVAGDGPGVTGWQIMATALGEAWATARSKEDQTGDVPPIPLAGTVPPCPLPALHRVDGYSRGKRSLYGELECVVTACGAHARQWRDRLTATVGTGFDNGPRPTTDTECGHVTNYNDLLRRTPDHLHTPVGEPDA
jgi:hypothetical protein